MTVGVGVRVGVEVLVGRGVLVGLGVEVGSRVLVGLGVEVAGGLGVEVGRGVSLGSGVAVGRGVLVAGGASVGRLVAVAADVAVGGAVGTGVSVITIGDGIGGGVGEPSATAVGVARSGPHPAARQAATSSTMITSSRFEMFIAFSPGSGGYRISESNGTLIICQFCSL